MAQGPGSKDIESLLVRVDGIVRTNVEEIDETAVFVRLATAQVLTGLEGAGAPGGGCARRHGSDRPRGSHPALARRRRLEVLTWSQLMPGQRDLVRLNTAARVLVFVAFFVIIECLVLNTLEMAVIERRANTRCSMPSA